MTITGCLSEFSLPEILHFLERGSKSGLLTVKALSGRSGRPKRHYIWVNQGRIIAAAGRLDHRGLISLIAKRGLLPVRGAIGLARHYASSDRPLGLRFRSEGLLSTEHLKLLFRLQVTRQIGALFELEEAWFQIESACLPPLEEMTGLSILATQVTLPSLRTLRNWTSLENKLPQPCSTLISAMEGKPKQRLNQVEWQVWEFTNGNMSLKEIAQQLNLSIHQVQRVAFGLIAVGLVREISSCKHLPRTGGFENYSKFESRTPIGLSGPSFLQGLASFLQGKSSIGSSI